VAAQIIEEQAQTPETAGPRAGLDRPGCELGQPVLEERARDVARAAQRPAPVLAELDEQTHPAQVPANRREREAAANSGGFAALAPFP
jgi:hypothetical protein